MLNSRREDTTWESISIWEVNINLVLEGKVLMMGAGLNCLRIGSSAGLWEIGDEFIDPQSTNGVRKALRSGLCCLVKQLDKTANARETNGECNVAIMTLLFRTRPFRLRQLSVGELPANPRDTGASLSHPFRG
jgi:hypothetical protein